jgi:hypothetical protein
VRVIDPFQTILIVASLLLAAAAGVYVALGRTPDRVLIGACTLLELALLVQAVIGIGQAVRGDRVMDTFTFVGYLVGALLVLPAGVVWSLSERSRGATSVLVVAGVTVAFLIVRLGQVYGA